MGNRLPYGCSVVDRSGVDTVAEMLTAIKRNHLSDVCSCDPMKAWSPGFGMTSAMYSGHGGINVAGEGADDVEDAGEAAGADLRLVPACLENEVPHVVGVPLNSFTCESVR